MTLNDKYDMLPRKAFAAMINLAAAFGNGAVAMWLHGRGSSAYIINAMSAGFSLTLAIVFGIGYLTLKSDIRQEEMRNRLCGVR